MHAEPGLEEDPNPFDAEKDAERQALLNRADRTGRKGTKKLTTLTVCVAVLFLAILDLQPSARGVGRIALEKDLFNTHAAL